MTGDRILGGAAPAVGPTPQEMQDRAAWFGRMQLTVTSPPLA